MCEFVELKCEYDEITSVPDLKEINSYKDMVKPLNYNFSLNKGEFYNALGLKFFDNTAWLYLLPKNPKWNELIYFVPIVLFKFDWAKIPSEWFIRSDPEDKKVIEILPKFLADIPNWFERYTDEDEEVIEVINKEILNLKQKYVPEPDDPYAWPFEEYR